MTKVILTTNIALSCLSIYKTSPVSVSKLLILTTFLSLNNLLIVTHPDNFQYRHKSIRDRCKLLWNLTVLQNNSLFEFLIFYQSFHCDNWPIQCNGKPLILFKKIKDFLFSVENQLKTTFRCNFKSIFFGLLTFGILLKILPIMPPQNVTIF